MNYVIEKENLLNESDVEQKILYPLLTNQYPIGLEYSNTTIQTKANLKRLKIGKGNEAKLYYPDYIVIIEGIPRIILEAKTPGSDLLEAYREARLYASEVNSFFPEDINPCNFVISSDGTRLLAGSYDSLNPKFDIKIENWLSTNSSFVNFADSFGKRKIEESTINIKQKLRTNVTYRKPIHRLGGKHIQNKLINNSFGENLSIQYRHVFNPEEENERIDVVKNSYVKTPKHLSHVIPINKLIRKKVRPSTADSVEIDNNIEPKALISKLQNLRNYNNQVLLLIGSVGSGKSTFTTYLKNVAIDQNLSEKLVWVRLNLNNAPVSSLEIYTWLKQSICDSLERTDETIDPHMIDSLKQIYRKEIENFNKTILGVFDENSIDYKREFFKEIKELKDNLDKKLTSYINFYVREKGKELIIVLDNCDKRNLEEQLLMFEVANWLKENTESLVFLPLRETTFDHYRNQKPLDTVIKDLIFRINPPSLQKVIYNRIKYFSRLSEKNDSNYYYLPNGIRVNYPNEEELKYLNSILKSLFQNHYFKKLISGLAGRDIRKGIEIFLDFCKSGHISEEHIFQMKNNKEYVLPDYLISRVFLRGNRLYYSDSDTKIKNLFHSDPGDKLPDPFSRMAILTWLDSKQKEKGISGIRGYHRVENILQDLNLKGHSIDRLNKELVSLLKHNLIISESQNYDSIDNNELISISSSGIIHLMLVEDISYLSSCAEDVWYNDESLSEGIVARISNKKSKTHFMLQTSVDNSLDLLTYLESYYDLFFNPQVSMISESIKKGYVNFDKLKAKLNNKKRLPGSLNLEKETLIQEGSLVNCILNNIENFGMFFDIKGSNKIGFLHHKNFNETLEEAEVGDELELIIKLFNVEHDKYELMTKEEIDVIGNIKVEKK